MDDLFSTIKFASTIRAMNVAEFYAFDVEKYLELDDVFWNTCHDFIQWVFPTNEPSQFNKNAPVIDAIQIKDLLEVKDFDIKYKKAIGRYCEFLGIAFYDDKFELADDWHEKVIYWLGPKTFDHNHLRITRLLKSMKLLGFQELQIKLFSFLQKFEKYINPTSFEFWKNAL
jgi:hypothetical protein